MDRENARKARERSLRRQELASQKKSFALGAAMEERYAKEAALYNALIDDGDEPDRLLAFHPAYAVPSTVSAISGAYGSPHERQPSAARHRWTVAGDLDGHAEELM